MSSKHDSDRKEYGQSALNLHREIRSVVERAAKKDEVSCVLVTAIEKELRKDPRTVRFHLRLLEESGYGHFAADGKLFCVKSAERKT